MRAEGQHLLDVGGLGRAGDQHQVGRHAGGGQVLCGDGRRQAGEEIAGAQHRHMQRRHQRERARLVRPGAQQQRAGVGDAGACGGQAGVDAVEQLGLPVLQRSVEAAGLDLGQRGHEAGIGRRPAAHSHAARAVLGQHRAHHRRPVGGRGVAQVGAPAARGGLERADQRGRIDACTQAAAAERPGVIGRQRRHGQRLRRRALAQPGEDGATGGAGVGGRGGRGHAEGSVIRR